MKDVFVFNGEMSDKYSSLHAHDYIFCGWERTEKLIERLKQQTETDVWNKNLHGLLKSVITLDKLVYKLVIERCNIYLFKQDVGCHHSTNKACLSMFSHPVVGCTFNSVEEQSNEQFLVASTFDIHRIFTECLSCGLVKRYNTNKVEYKGEQK